MDERRRLVMLEQLYGSSAPWGDDILEAYNAAFEELGFDWHWDRLDGEDLLAIADERERIEHYVRTRHPHLLKAYDPDFLRELIYRTKTRLCAPAGRLRVHTAAAAHAA
jgi:hypothetical protein